MIRAGSGRGGGQPPPVFAICSGASLVPRKPLVWFTAMTRSQPARRAARVIDGRTVRARVIEQLVVALHARSRQVLVDDVFGERRRGEQTPQELEPADNRALIGVLGGRFSDAGRPHARG